MNPFLKRVNLKRDDKSALLPKGVNQLLKGVAHLMRIFNPKQNHKIRKGDKSESATEKSVLYSERNEVLLTKFEPSTERSEPAAE